MVLVRRGAKIHKDIDILATTITIDLYVIYYFSLFFQGISILFDLTHPRPPTHKVKPQAVPRLRSMNNRSVCASFLRGSTGSIVIARCQFVAVGECEETMMI